MDKQHIVSEIQRTAKINGGVPLGWRRMETEAGVKYHDWYGRFWVRWGDAVREAGFEPNRMSEAFDEAYLLERLALLSRQLKRVPIQGDLLMAAKGDETFPSEKVFRRLGSKPQRILRVIEFCESRADFEDIATLWRDAIQPDVLSDGAECDASPVGLGYVYLLQHGSRREYKIGRTNNPLRREGELGIQLPEKLLPVHYIATDDPAGIENYWHKRFSVKRKEGEWFALTVEDVRAFKKWKRIS